MIKIKKIFSIENALLMVGTFVSVKALKFIGKLTVNSMDGSEVIHVFIENEHFLSFVVATVLMFIASSFSMLILTGWMQTISNNLSDIALDYIPRICLPVSLLVAMLTTLNESEFATLGTAISFVSILVYLLPQNGKQMLDEFRSYFRNQWNQHNKK